MDTQVKMMKLVVLRRTISFIAWAISLSVSASPLRAQNNEAPCGNKSEYESRASQLRATVNELLAALKATNGRTLLKYVDKDGISLWGGTLSPAEIKKELRDRDGIYCLLFSTACLSTAEFPNGVYVNTAKWKISYSEWLSRHKAFKIEPEMFYGGEANPCHANVSVRSVDNPAPDQLTFELGFDFKRGSWKLVSTPAYPEGIASLSSSEKHLPRTN